MSNTQSMPSLKEECVTVKYMQELFFTYRGLFKCSCGRAYSPYGKGGKVYYASKCKKGCKNTVRSVDEDLLIEEAQKVIEKIHFTDKELEEIEAGAKSGLKRAAAQRDKIINDAETRKKRILGDLDYLKQNKVTILREKAMSPTELHAESQRLLQELKEVDAILNAQTETEEEMVQFVLRFSEIMKLASSLYKDTLDMEKRRLTSLIFSYLVLVDGKVASYKAKEEFEPLLNRPSVQNGSPGWIRTSDLGVNSALLYR